MGVCDNVCACMCVSMDYVINVCVCDVINICVCDVINVCVCV